MEHLPFDFDLDAITSDFSDQALNEEMLAFPTDDVVTTPPRKRGHRRSSSDPFPLQGQLDLESFDANSGKFEDVEMSDIFETSDFAGLVAIPSAAPPPNPEVIDKPPVPNFGLSPFLQTHTIPMMDTVKHEIAFNPTVSQATDPAWIPGPRFEPSNSKVTPQVTKNSRSKGYACGRCGQPKRGHICPAIHRKMSSMGTQIDMVNPAQERVLIARPRSIL